MYKKITYFIFVIMLFNFFAINVNALSSHEFLEDTTLVLARQDNCDALFGDPEVEGSFGHYLQQIFSIFKFLAPTLVVVLTILDFIKATASQDKDALAKATGKAGKRIFLALLLFFIPGLVNFLFDLLGWYGTCGIG